MLRSSLFRPLALTAAAALLITTSACSTQNTPSSKPSIVVGAYPFAYVAEAVVGDKAEVNNLLAPGADSHDLELSPQQTAAVKKADLVVYQSKLQASLDEAVQQQSPKNVLDSADFLELRLANANDHGDSDEHEHADEHEHEHEHEHGKYDPHVWLNPANVSEIGDKVAEKMAEIDPDNADSYKANAEKLTETMKTLDKDFETGLANCEIHTFITNHAAFGYLADRYGLDQIGISGLSTEDEPSPARIEEIQKTAKATNVTTIFYEQAVSSKVAETIASDLGLETDVLDPVETLSDKSKGKDYAEVMRSNLESLKKANRCS
uniref:metal ABC transporter substrate-binding protein n=1 Tax=Vaginimicrobium propionicum TaxID=1871034 RepID=UPI000970B92F|nr:metal ABC transporter substrate-binding protein [Vaginimicrobium propionicum]